MRNGRGRGKRPGMATREGERPGMGAGGGGGREREGIEAGKKKRKEKFFFVRNRPVDLLSGACGGQNEREKKNFGPPEHPPGLFIEELLLLLGLAAGVVGFPFCETDFPLCHWFEALQTFFFSFASLLLKIRFYKEVTFDPKKRALISS